MFGMQRLLRGGTVLVAVAACTPVPTDPAASMLVDVQRSELGIAEGCWTMDPQEDASALCIDPHRVVMDTTYTTHQSRVTRIEADGNALAIHESRDCTVVKATGATNDERGIVDPDAHPTRIMVERDHIRLIGEEGREVLMQRLDMAMPPDPCSVAAKAARDAGWPDFWELVERTRADAASCHGPVTPASAEACCVEHAKKLREELTAGTKDRLATFWIAQERVLNRAYTHELWGAAFVAEGGCNDDCFYDFRAWLVSQGRTAFEQVLARPEEVATLLRAHERPLCRDFGSAPHDAFDIKAGIPRERTGWSDVELPPMLSNPSGTQWREQDLAARYPTLCKRFGSC